MHVVLSWRMAQLFTPGMVIFKLFKTEPALKAGSVISMLIFCKICYAQTNALVTIFQAGNCKNINYADKYIDSLCKKNGILHLYYLKGIKENEMKKYANKLFGRAFDLKSLVSKENINKWQLDKITATNVAAIIKEDRIVNISDLDGFEENELLSIKFVGEKQIVSNRQFNSTLIDSFQLNYKTKIKIDSQVRLNKLCIIVKQDSFLYILEPLFDETLYKVNCNTGKITNQLLLRNLIPYDSILYYHFATVENGISGDTIEKYANMAGRDPNKRFFNLFISKNQLIVSGDYQMLTFITRYKVINLSHSIIYKFDLDLEFKNYYFDRHLNYSGYYPVEHANDNNSSIDRIQYQIDQDFNQQLTKKRIIYFNLQDKNHNLNKFDKDTLDIPKSFKGAFYSNDIRNFANMSTKENPVWLFDPYPYLYFPKDSFYHDLIQDTLLKTIVYLKETPNNVCVFKTYKKNDNEMVIILEYKNKTYRIDYNITNRKITRKLNMNSLTKYNLQLLVDDSGNSYFCPIESEDSGNYLYLD